MALSSNVPLCAAGDCYEQLSIEGSPASPRRAADGGQGFGRKPRTMAMERIARRCDGPKSNNLQRLGFACFHREGLADMRPGFDREPGTMDER